MLEDKVQIGPLATNNFVKRGLNWSLEEGLNGIRESFKRGLKALIEG